MTGGRGPQMTGGPGYIRSGAVPYREPGSRKPEDAFAVLLKARRKSERERLLMAPRSCTRQPRPEPRHDQGARGSKVDFDQPNNDGLTALDVAEGKQPAGAAPAGRRSSRRATRRRRTWSRSSRRRNNRSRGGEAAPRIDGPAASADLRHPASEPPATNRRQRSPCSDAENQQ